MTVSEAEELLADASVPEDDAMFATSRLMTAVEAGDRVDVEQLYGALRHGGETAVMAARALNVATGRRRPDEVEVSDLIVSEEFWKSFRRKADPQH